MNNQVEVEVCGAQKMIPCTYKTVVLKPNIINDKNILTQGMMSTTDTKYVIKSDFIIDTDIINGSVSVSTSNVSRCANPAYAEALSAYNVAHDAWIAADNAYTNDPNETTLAAKNAAYAAYQEAEATLTGTPQYYYYANKAITIKKGRRITIPDSCVLLDNTLSYIVGFDVAPADTIVYIGSTTAGTYAYNIQNAIVIPSGCLIEFDGGSISNGTLFGNETILVYDQEQEVVLKNVVLLGDFEESAGGGGINKKDNVNGMATITLKKDKTFAEQLTQENTIYRIMYDFTLGEDITIPDNCVLEFDGGSISGAYTITFQNTELLGTFDSIIYTVGLAGTIKGSVNIAYWNLKYNDNTYDNGVVINKVCSIFKKVYIPAGSLYFTTPIIMNEMLLIQCDATLIYKGTTTNTAAVKITRGQGIYNFNRIVGQFNINYTEANNTKVIGLDLNSCNSCELRFVDIRYFNEGLRISDTNSKGCSCNTIHLGLIAHCNFGLRIYQGGSGTNWCNQNLFLGGWITFTSGWNFTNPSWCVFAYGAKYEGQSDSYDHVNNLTFIGLCVEEQNGIYLRNGQYIKIIGARHENSIHPLKLVGNCRAIEWNYSHPATGKIDVTENAYCGLSARSQVQWITQTTNNNTPIVIDTTVYRAFTAGLFKMGRILIDYLEDTNGALDTRAKKVAYPKIQNYYFDANGKLDPGLDVKVTGEIFFIPDGITKVAITLGSTGGTLQLYNL